MTSLEPSRPPLSSSSTGGAPSLPALSPLSSTAPAALPPSPELIGVIGGSGLYQFLDSSNEVEVATPFGAPSDPIVVGEVGGQGVAFVPRHGRDHRFPPHRVNYRANLWALRSLGVRHVVAPCAVGSLHPELGPGHSSSPIRWSTGRPGGNTRSTTLKGPSPTSPSLIPTASAAAKRYSPKQHVRGGLHAREAPWS